jgi:hypothetical protein
MSLSIGIVGLPNVGKSTLFNTITKKQVDIANYPFCTIDPNVGVVMVPDERVDKLTDLMNSERKIYTTIEFFDIAGLVKGANKGEGLGNKFLANIRETDAIVYVLRAFSNSNIINTQGDVDPLKEKDVLDTELMLKDLETLEKRIVGLEREVKAREKEAIKEHEVLTKAKSFLEDGKILSEQEFDKNERKVLSQYQLLTMKPRLYLLNGEKKEVEEKDFVKVFKENEWPFLIVDILSENEVIDMSKDERISLGLEPESNLKNLIKRSYDILGLITFLTTGKDETRAWTIREGSTAPEAGGVIHSDFQDKFIKAEVINWRELLEAGGIAEAREKGLIRTEGKDYIVKDGDVIEIKHCA